MVPLYYINLVSWLHRYPPQKINSFNYGKDANYNCNTNCHAIKEDIGRINILINKLRQLLDFLIKKINHDENFNSYLEFLDNNLEICQYVMKTNIYIKNLLRLINIINNCDTLSCHEILEINELFNKNIEFKFKLFSIIEIIFGNIIRLEQWEKINSIYDNYTKKNKFEIHQFMMGKGKSSLITPLLVVAIHYNLINTNNDIYIIVPSHLIEQTNASYSNPVIGVVVRVTVTTTSTPVKF